MKNKEWRSLKNNPPERQCIGGFFEIKTGPFSEPFLGKLVCDANGRDMYFEDSQGNGYAGYVKYRYLDND